MTSSTSSTKRAAEIVDPVLTNPSRRPLDKILHNANPAKKRGVRSIPDAHEIEQTPVTLYLDQKDAAASIAGLEGAQPSATAAAFLNRTTGPQPIATKLPRRPLGEISVNANSAKKRGVGPIPDTQHGIEKTHLTLSRDPTDTAAPTTGLDTSDLVATSTGTLKRTTGPQPMKDNPFVKTAPLPTAKSMVRVKLENTYSRADANFVSNKDVLRKMKEEVRDRLTAQFVTHTAGHVYTVCDYTGSILSWTPGPFSRSVEAVYPFAIVNDQLAYHAPGNVSTTSMTANWVKKKHPILVLPLLGVWLRNHQEPDFQRRKAVWTWTYTAMANVFLMHKVFHLILDHKPQIDKWKEWDQDKREAVLGHLRTGSYGPVLDQELHSWRTKDLLEQWHASHVKTN